MIFFTSDTHFNHLNICRATSKWSDISRTRNFSSLDLMNQTIIDNINSVVSSNDILYHLGDYSFGSADNYQKFREQINCNNIHLILGNHDNKHGKENDPVMSNGRHVSSLFESYGYYKEIFIKRAYFILFHYPVVNWNYNNKGAIHLFGHCHSSEHDKFFHGGKSIDVGVDGNNYMPYKMKY